MQRVVCLFAVCTMLIAGCGVDWLPLTDPDAPASVTVTQTPASSNSVTISATVKKTNGNPVADGTSVSFSTTGGSLSLSSAPTSGGIATVTLTSADAGSFTVTASTGNTSGNAVVVFKDTVTLTASPNPITAINSQPATITATVKNPDGSNVADGTAISFAITSGTGGTLPNSSATTTGGVATVSFFSGTTGAFTITATVGAATGTVSVTVQ